MAGIAGSGAGGQVVQGPPPAATDLPPTIIAGIAAPTGLIIVAAVVGGALLAMSASRARTRRRMDSLARRRKMSLAKVRAAERSLMRVAGVAPGGLAASAGGVALFDALSGLARVAEDAPAAPAGSGNSSTGGGSGDEDDAQALQIAIEGDEDDDDDGSFYVSGLRADGSSKASRSRKSGSGVTTVTGSSRRTAYKGESSAAAALRTAKQLRLRVAEATARLAPAIVAALRSTGGARAARVVVAGDGDKDDGAVELVEEKHASSAASGAATKGKAGSSGAGESSLPPGASPAQRLIAAAVGALVPQLSDTTLAQVAEATLAVVTQALSGADGLAWLLASAGPQRAAGSPLEAIVAAAANRLAAAFEDAPAEQTQALAEHAPACAAAVDAWRRESRCVTAAEATAGFGGAAAGPAGAFARTATAALPPHLQRWLAGPGAAASAALGGLGGSSLMMYRSAGAPGAGGSAAASAEAAAAAAAAAALTLPSRRQYDRAPASASIEALVVAALAATASAASNVVADGLTAFDAQTAVLAARVAQIATVAGGGRRPGDGSLAAALARLDEAAGAKESGGASNGTAVLHSSRALQRFEAAACAAHAVKLSAVRSIDAAAVKAAAGGAALPIDAGDDTFTRANPLAGGGAKGGKGQRGAANATLAAADSSGSGSVGARLLFRRLLSHDGAGAAPGIAGRTASGSRGDSNDSIKRGFAPQRVGGGVLNPSAAAAGFLRSLPSSYQGLARSIATAALPAAPPVPPLPALPPPRDMDAEEPDAAAGPSAAAFAAATSSRGDAGKAGGGSSGGRFMHAPVSVNAPSASSASTEGSDRAQTSRPSFAAATQSRSFKARRTGGGSTSNVSSSRGSTVASIFEGLGVSGSIAPADVAGGADGDASSPA